ncbi:ACT domain-containing protein [Mesobacillus maritimus]|uniref:ACT domain-containing protein n=1 Tax=Mesobacillus maritimus TaxID=1643336 RepID=UPI0020404B67|nr:ACT domain-containing protein [Mesobacillus maritimus]MCM3586985.1 ACT domain-containing protein [Mesobacillus maritimus]
MVCIKVEGVLDFSLTGILSSLANPLAENNISIFAISTYIQITYWLKLIPSKRQKSY